MGKETATGFTSEEMAELEPGDDDLGETTETIEEDDGGEDTQPSSGSAPPPPPAAKSPQTSSKPPQGHVPQQALHEAREQLKAERARAERMEETFRRFVERQAPPQQPNQQTEQIPDFQTDPVGHLQAKQAILERDLADARRTQSERQQQEQQQTQTQGMLDRYAASVRTFKRDTQDYDAAYQFLADARDRELEMLGFDDPTDRANRMQYEEGVIAGRALHGGKNPAQIFYEAAKARGYKGPAAAQEEDKLARLQKGANGAKTLNGGKAPTSEEMSLQHLSDLQDSDPDAADKLWEKMRRSGRLG